MKKFFESVYFNVILAVLAAVLIIMQEVWIGTPIVFLNSFVLGTCAAVGFSWAGEVIKLIAGGSFVWKRTIPGIIVGVIAALVTTLLVL